MSIWAIYIIFFNYLKIKGGGEVDRFQDDVTRIQQENSCCSSPFRHGILATPSPPCTLFFLKFEILYFVVIVGSQFFFSSFFVLLFAPVVPRHLLFYLFKVLNKICSMKFLELMLLVHYCGPFCFCCW